MQHWGRGGGEGPHKISFISYANSVQTLKRTSQIANILFADDNQFLLHINV